MNEPQYVTPTGRALSDDDIDALATEVATSEYDSRAIRRRGRPALGSGPSRFVPVRMESELHDALKVRAHDDRTTASDVVRTALRTYLERD